MRPPIVARTRFSNSLIQPLLHEPQIRFVINVAPNQVVAEFADSATTPNHVFGGELMLFQYSVGEVGSVPTHDMSH